MKGLLAFLAKELREVVPAFLFFFVLFHLVAITKAVSLEDYSFTSFRAAVATVAALIVAKAVMMADKVPTPARFADRMILQVLWNTFLFGALAILFKLMEELLPRVLEHRNLAGGFGAMVRETNWPQFALLTVWLFLGLLVYTLAMELVRLVGVERVRAIVFGRRGLAAKD